MDVPERYRQTARLHIAAINQGFLPQLGESFLALMYRAIDESKAGLLITDIQDDRIVGFVSGCVSMRQIYARMLRHPLRLFCALAPSLLRPSRVKRILDILRYDGGGQPDTPLPHAELLSIAVDAAYRGQQRADALYQGLEQRFAALGEAAFKITVGQSLIPAHKFYTRMGASPVAEIEVHAGERSVVYVQDIDTAAR